MFVTKKLIASYLPKVAKLSDKNFTAACSNLTFEIEQKITHPKLNKLVVGQIKKIDIVPGSEHLHVTKVDIGNKNYLQIVCGAQNLKINQKVIVALPGAKLHDGRVIKETKFLGVKSQGMLCAINELTPYANGLLADNELQEVIALRGVKATVGNKEVAKVLGLDDEIYELSLPTNRNDLAGALVLINEWSKYFNKEELIKVKANNYRTSTKNRVILDKKLSSFYLVANVKGFDVNPTPTDLHNKLLNVGIKVSNSTFVDEVNWCTYLTGIAPLLIDGNKVKGTLTQRLANDKEAITINGKTYVLCTKDVVLVDTKGTIIALDGIAVADDYKLMQGSTNALLYVSDLQFAYPRNTAIRLNINTLVGRYSRNQISQYQIALFLNQLKGIGQITVNDNFSKVNTTHKIPFSLKDCQNFLDGTISNAHILSSLNRLGYKYVANQKSVTVPSYRFDLENQYDIFEEVLKIYGIDNLANKPIYYTLSDDISKDPNYEYELINQVKQLLISKCFYEVKTYNLTSAKDVRNFNIFNLQPKYRVNPCSNKTHEFLRLSLIDGLLKVQSYNAGYKTPLHPIFEIQKIYTSQTYFNLTCVTPQEITLDGINNEKINLNSFGLKNILKQLATIFNAEFKLEFNVPNDYLYQNDCCQVSCNNQIIGYLGCIKSNLLKPYKLPTNNIYVLTLNLEGLIKNYQPAKTKLQKIIKSPMVARDITFEANKTTNLLNIQKELNQLPFISKWQFTKAYHLEQSIAYTIHLDIFDHVSGGTLSKEMIDQQIKKIMGVIKNNKGVIKS